VWAFYPIQTGTGTADNGFGCWTNSYLSYGTDPGDDSGLPTQYGLMCGAWSGLLPIAGFGTPVNVSVVGDDAPESAVDALLSALRGVKPIIVVEPAVGQYCWAFYFPNGEVTTNASHAFERGPFSTGNSSCEITVDR
jgi:hypothetical protein